MVEIKASKKHDFIYYARNSDRPDKIVKLDQFERNAILKGAMRISWGAPDPQPVVTLQKNPDWFDGWGGDKHFEKDGARMREYNKWLPLLMNDYVEELAASQQRPH